MRAVMAIVRIALPKSCLTGPVCSLIRAFPVISGFFGDHREPVAEKGV
jgi:hypothetical protein